LWPAILAGLGFLGHSARPFHAFSYGRDFSKSFAKESEKVSLAFGRALR
jgi:hypothetical protein